MQQFVQDFKHALRMFRESRAFLAAALMSLTIGMGANVAIFSVVNAILLKPLPFPEPNRLVMLMISQNRVPVLPFASPAQFMYWRNQTDILEHVAAFTNTSLNYVGNGHVPDQLRAAQVSKGYFRTFGARFAEGRGFTAKEDLPGGSRSVVISHAFWSRQLGADTDIIGKRILLSGKPYTVVGIMGPEFDMREFGNPQLWIPLQVDPNTTDRAYIYQVAARLKPGVTLKQAQDRLEASVSGFRKRFPGVLRTQPRGGFSVLPMQKAIVGHGVDATLFMLLGAVGLILLIACANVANLLLVHANGRGREIAVRSALGASRARIIRQLVTESLLLSLTAGTLGLIAGFLGIRALLNVNTAGLPRLGESGTLVTIDWRIVAFTLGVALATVLVFGVAPALAGSRAKLVETIGSVNRSAGGIRQGKVRSTLVIAEIGLAVVLLIGAGLLIRTWSALSQVDPGFSASNVLTMRTSMSGPRFATTDKMEQTIHNAREHILSIPGVVDAVATCCVPMQRGWGMPFNIPGRAHAGLYTGSNPVVFTSPGYFVSFKIPVLRGRAFNDRDDASAPPVAIVNTAFAKKYWSGHEDPLRGYIRIGGGAANMKQYAEERVRQIIGVVGDVRGVGLADTPKPAIYVPRAQLSDRLNELIASRLPTVWVVRTQGDPVTVSRAVQQELRREIGLPITDVQTMTQIESLSISRQRLNMLLMAVFGGSAMFLAAIGIYGVLAYSVQQRMHEIGIRMAMGADAGRVKGMVVRQGMTLVAIGIAAGLVAAFYTAHVLASWLFGVKPRDPVVFVAVPVVLALIALVSVWLPARRASRVNPLDALRYE